MQDDYAGDTSTTGILTVGGQITGNIELPNDYDWFKVSLTAGTIYVFELLGADSGGGTFSSTGFHQLFLNLYDASGTSIHFTDEGGPSGDPLMSYTPKVSGNYYLSASDLSNTGTGTYTLKATDVGAGADDYAGNTSTTGILTIGGQVTGNIELPNDNDWFKVSLTAGTGYIFELLGADGGGGTLSHTPYLGLYNASGLWIHSTDEGGPSGDPLMSYTPIVSGNYYLSASTVTGTGTGTYTLKASYVGAGADDYANYTSTTGILTVGGQVTGNIELPNDHDWFKVSLTAGTAYVFELLGAVGRGGTLLSDGHFHEAFLQLYNESGSRIGYAFDGGPSGDPLLSYTPTISGNYYLSASDLFDTGTGTYTLKANIAGQTIIGTSGNDTLTGGAGLDTVVLSGLPSQYKLSGNTLTGIEGTDIVSSIEQYRFGSSLRYNIYDNIYVSDLSPSALTDPDGAGPADTPATDLLHSISDLYVAYFNRAPDVAGLMYWFAEISKGSLTLASTAQSFTDSPEYKAAYPVGQSNHDFVNAIYQNLFDRSPDSAGWDYWEGDLNHGTPRNVFIYTVIQGAYAPTGGASDKALLNNKHDVSLYYSEQLATHPSEGFDNNIDQVLNRVTANVHTVEQAEAVIDYVIENPITLTGVINDTPTWNAFWA